MTTRCGADARKGSRTSPSAAGAACNASSSASYAPPVLTTTLASSRWKSLDQVNAAGEWACAQVDGVTWWPQNWRKGGLQERRNEIIRSERFYNQLYCGCEYSIRPGLDPESV